MTIDEIMRAAPVIPVLVLEGDADWSKLAETFVAAGLPVLEVTLRTPNAFSAIRQMAKVPGAIVGAGTVLNKSQLHDAIDAGSRFIVAPGLTDPLSKAAAELGVPYLPGVATAGDIMRGLDLGLNRFKFFPAEASGGIAALNALAAPFGDVGFCPTGGIRPDSAERWLALGSVLCIGGSWLYRSGESLDEVAQRAHSAAALLA